MGILTGYYRRILRLDDPSLRSRPTPSPPGSKVKEFPAAALAQAALVPTASGRRSARLPGDLDLGRAASGGGDGGTGGAARQAAAQRGGASTEWAALGTLRRSGRPGVRAAWAALVPCAVASDQR
jgi:hypothetical protein